MPCTLVTDERFWSKVPCDEAAVERAARALYEGMGKAAQWDEVAEWVRAECRDRARVVLSAAARTQEDT